MRRQFLTVAGALLLSLITVLPASAHIRKGTTVLQGNASLSSSSGALYSNSTITNFVVSPSVRYFIADHWALGGQMYLNYIKQGPAHSTNFELGPSGAYYFGDMDAKTIPYVGSSLLFRTLSTQYGGSDNSISENGTALSFFGGLSLFLTEHLAVTPEVAVNLESLGGHTGTTVLVGAGLAGFLYKPVYHTERAPRVR